MEFAARPSSPTAIDGPRLSPASGRPAKTLVVFLHGYGADGNDLISIGRQWAQFLPDTAFVAPHAPQPCAVAPVGRQWFPLTMRNVEERWDGVTAAGPTLDSFLDTERDRHGLTDGDIALVGFSQGTMMALHVGLRRNRPLAGIVGYSGLLAGPDHLKGDLTHVVPVTLVHGDSDDIVPISFLFESANALGAAGIPVEWHVSRGIGHGIDEDGLYIGASFLRRVLVA